MAEQVKKFRPERPIYLSTENTGCKTHDDVIFAIERLRDKGWLCTYGEKARPFHMCFNDVREFNEFKKCASELSIKLKSPVIKTEELEQLETEETSGQEVAGGLANSSYEDPSGKVHIE